MRNPLPHPNKKWSPFDGWYAADASERIANPMVIKGERLLPWDLLPSEIDPSSVETLRVFSVEPTADRGLPRYVEGLSRLVDLIVPSQVIPTLHPGLLPRGVKRLGVESGDKVVRFAADVSFPAIEELYSPVPILFEPGTFPCLRFLHLRLDRKNTMLARLPAIGALTALGLGPFNNPKIFETLGLLRLDWFAAYGTRSITTLEGIGRLSNLDAFRLFEFPRLTNLEPLLRLPRLNEVEVSWCPRITDFSALELIKTLKSVEFYFCDPTAVESIRPRLEVKGVRVQPAAVPRNE